ncbi:MAG: gamma-glutamyltranspeptidase/glutathione hydrolase [Candidatus Poriferisodalaceae bacterium]|jgi:gamma-glutamyltranspeptidase/glutathione hydrolase
MVCSIDHIASSAGLAMLRAGGSAADAAVATSAVLAVTTQHMCGMGGDLWALVHHTDGQAPAALNASGRAGSGADPDRLRSEGHTEMPFKGDIRTVPVPGCVDGWLSLLESYGRLPVAEVLAPAIELADDGFAIGPQCAFAVQQLDGIAHTEDYFPGGANARTGQLVKRAGIARALRAVVEGGRAAHYEGDFGAALIELGAGEYSAEDLATSQAEWVTPLETTAWGHRILTVPPASQGYLSLAAAYIASGLPLPEDPEDPAWVHLLIEAAKQAGYDRKDSLYDGADGAALLAPERLDPRRDSISPTGVSVVPGGTNAGDTIYLCAVDDDRMGVSLIQSNASGWGAMLFVPGFGISLHNRGLGFNLDPGHPAEYRAGNRPPHTLAPALIQTMDRSLRSVLGTMGGDTQPQIVLQMLARLLQAGQDPAAAISSGRFRLAGSEPTGFHTWAEPNQLTVEIEGHASHGWSQGLSDIGHSVRESRSHDSGFGHAHLIEVQGEVLAGASDPRAFTGGVAAY